MARPLTLNSVLEVVNIGTGNGGTLLNVWHYKLDGFFAGLVDGDAVVNALKAVIQPGNPNNLLEFLKDMCHETVTWQRVRYQWITPIRYTPTDSTVGQGPGQVANQALPMNIAGVATCRTLFAGRTGVGRKHFGGLAVSSVNAGLMTPLWQADAIAIMALMMTPIDLTAIMPGLTLQPVVFHRANPTTSHVWDNYVIQDTARVMRRRTLGVGV